MQATWAEDKAEFLHVKPGCDADRAAQSIVAKIKDRHEMQATYRAAPDLFESMRHPRLNLLCYQLL